MTGLIILNIYHWECRPLSSIGLVAPTWRSLGWGIVALLVGIVTFGFMFPLVNAVGLNITVDGIFWLEQFPIWFLVVAAVTAGVTEEILFRGYVLERLGELSDNICIDALVSAIVFMLLHI